MICTCLLNSYGHVIFHKVEIVSGKVAFSLNKRFRGLQNARNSQSL